jgi:nucleotide-binding universal stress UspA family protein
VTDVAAPLADDTEALSPFFVILGVLIPSLGAGSASALAFRQARPAWCVAAPAVVAVVVGVIAAGIADSVSGLGNYAAVAGIVALFSLAVSAPTATLGRIWPPLVSVAVLVFIVLGIPASGGPANLGSFGPAFLRVLHPALPLGAAAGAVRGAVYFSGYGTAAPAWVLAAWATAGMIGLIFAVSLRRRAPVRLVPPVSRSSQNLTVPAAALANGHASARMPATDPVPARSAWPGPTADGLGLSGTVPVGTIPGDLTRAGSAATASIPAGTARHDRWSEILATGPAQPPAPVGHASSPFMVIGFDNSGPAQRALAWTARLAAAHPVVLHIIYADHVSIDSDLSGFAHAEMTAARNEEASNVEQAAMEIIAGAGVPCTFERRQGAPADAILAGARARAAATPDGSGPIIVVGRSGRAAHHVLGSVPVRLLHRSPYPVLAIP